ncbi:MAG TPA: hypothetical protein VHT29_11475 [Solirubrobacteraceae bacterium]|jgi:hypothetical protein|nr:hypothetical protein [Solirubrobacteraceae bacterium]
MTVRGRWRGALAGLVCALAGFSCAQTPAFGVGFGIEPGSFATTLSGSRAGEHADLTTTFTLNQEPANHPIGYLKGLQLNLPAGFTGDPSATPRCSMGDVVKDLCPENAAVGVAKIGTSAPPLLTKVNHSTVLIYNIAPYANEPAAFGFDSGSLAVRLDAGLSASDQYGLSLRATDVSDAEPLVSADITLWGFPAEHNGPGPLETTQCRINEEIGEEECATYGEPGSEPKLPLLTNPVSCSQSISSFLAVDSWQEPDPFPLEAGTLSATTECGGLSFEPSVSLSPTSAVAREPTGYAVTVKLPAAHEPAARAGADLESAEFRLPSGTVVSPSAGKGLKACSESQFKMEAATALPVPFPAPVSSAECPPASQIGTVEIKTQVLGEPMTGQLYLGGPECSPCTSRDAQEGRMLRLLVQAAGSGVVVKLKGHLSVQEGSGLIVAVIARSPELPVEELKLIFDGGSTALLANPSECADPLRGSGSLTPYNTETPTEVSSAPFQLTGCSGPQFAPAFNAGTVANQAGVPSPAVVTITRSDQDQSLGRFTVRMPPGLLGLLSKVPACPSAAAQQGACGAQSEIGSVSIAAGPGERPLNLSGKVFLTGPYAGAPFGLSIVTPAQAGPIDLGTINIQAGIYVDSTTAALTIASGEVPQSLAGIPLQIRSLSLDIDRQGFIVDPTDCRPQAISADLASAQGTATSASQHYQVAGCAKLPFKPQLTALAGAKTTRLGGASVHLKLASGAGQANVSKVKIDLPKALPSRLTTLQGACREAVFKTNPANCPASSVLGTGAITTPFLRAVMTGPVYMVSHGSRAFPDLDAVVAAEGVTLTLVGTTAFTNGISSEAFRTLPDAPISTLDLMFPASSHSAFAANANLCKRALPMPTELTGQNGAVVKQTVKIAVSGCPVQHARLQRKGAKP